MKTDNKNIPSHHTEKGFRNPYPGFEKRGFGDFLKWVLLERRKSRRKYENTRFTIEKIQNDDSILRENNREFTVTWIGHSTVLIQLEGVNILMDPIWSDRASPLSFVGPERYSEPGIAFEDLPEIHIVLVTHNHYDHLDRPTIERLGSLPLYLVPLGLGAFLEKIGIEHYRELDWWNSFSYRGLEFSCTPAQHFSARGLFGHNKTLWCSWAAGGEKGSFYFAGDTGYFPGLKEIGERRGPFDLVCLPIGAYLPEWFMGPVHLSPKEAITAYRDLRGRIILPIHWGAFQLADDPPGLAPSVFLEEAAKQNLTGDQYWLLKHGETRRIMTVNSLETYKEELSGSR
ncbi:MBL fold metallo-hydrolase [Candidatus Latescibacterota bacterium]